MQENFKDLQAFVTVAREKSFTRAAAQLGVSQSALSHAMRALEERLGIRLLTRTTRSVSMTEAGTRLFNSVAPRFQEIVDELHLLSEFRDKPAGLFRISTAEHAANFVLWPKLEKFLPQYPDIRVEVTVDYTLADIVAQQYDAGVRLGDQVAKDMIAVRISGELQMATVASPAYFAAYSRPQHPRDLAGHNCINLRLPTYNSLLTWEYQQQNEWLKVRVEGQLIFNNGSSILRAVLGGFGIAYLPLDAVSEHLQSGQLVQVLTDWAPTFPAYYLYYPSRKQKSPGFTLLIEALKQQI